MFPVLAPSRSFSLVNNSRYPMLLPKKNKLHELLANHNLQPYYYFHHKLCLEMYPINFEVNDYLCKLERKISMSASVIDFTVIPACYFIINITLVEFWYLAVIQK